jgi:glycosyltransferase involved in cell wall biosynthesis
VAEVSVVIPAFNAARHLAAALQSALAQTTGEPELIVVDDGSSDGTAQVAAAFGPKVRLLRQENRGVAAARNRGLEAASGRWVALLDADDLWLPAKLERQLAALHGRSGSVCYTAIAMVDEAGRALEDLDWRAEPAVSLETLLLRNGIAGGASSLLAERDALRAAGGFDPALSLCADWDLWIRLALRHSFVHVPEALTVYRRHGGNMSRSAALLERDTLQLLRKAFASQELPAAARRLEARAYGHNYAVLAGSYLHAGRRREAVRCARAAVARDWRQVPRIAGFPLRALRRRLRRPGR